MTEDRFAQVPVERSLLTAVLDGVRLQATPASMAHLAMSPMKYLRSVVARTWILRSGEGK